MRFRQPCQNARPRFSPGSKATSFAPQIIPQYAWSIAGRPPATPKLNHNPTAAITAITTRNHPRTGRPGSSGLACSSVRVVSGLRSATASNRTAIFRPPDGLCLRPRAKAGSPPAHDAHSNTDTIEDFLGDRSTHFWTINSRNRLALGLAVGDGNTAIRHSQDQDHRRKPRF